MSGPYDTTHRDFMATVTEHAIRKANKGSKLWKARLHALHYGASFKRLAQIGNADDAIEDIEARAADRVAFLSAFGSLVGKAYRETFRRLP